MKRILAVAVAVLCSVPLFAGDGSIRKARRVVKDRYIVRLSDSLSREQVHALANGLSHQHGGKVHFVFEAVVPGFSVTLPEGAARAISHHPFVDYVEEVAEGEIMQAQTSAPWHLDRIDQRYRDANGLTDGVYYQNCEGAGANIYVVDTGIRATHQEFWRTSTDTTSRVVAGYNARPGESQTEATNPCAGASGSYVCGSNVDLGGYCLNGGHGTSVASVAGGRQYGVYKAARLIAVRTHSCTDGKSLTDYVANAMQWIYTDSQTRTGPSVMNMSFGFEVATTANLTFMEEWIRKVVVERNITAVAAAHNADVPATDFSPARMSRSLGGKVITVGGSTNTDRRWKCNVANWWERPSIDNSATTCGQYGSASNWGSGIDIFAPAQNISSAAIKEVRDLGGCCYDSDTAERQYLRSGTSFAAPIVAGIAARHLRALSTRTPDDIWNLILTQATGDYPSVSPAAMPTTTDANSGPLNGSPNRLVFMQGISRCRAVGF